MMLKNVVICINRASVLHQITLLLDLNGSVFCVKLRGMMNEVERQWLRTCEIFLVFSLLFLCLVVI